MFITTRTLRGSDVFTSVCHSVHGEGLGMLGCLIPGPFPEYTRGGEYTGGWVYQGGGVGYQEEGRNGYTRRRGGIGYTRYTHPRWYTPWY